MKGVLGDPLLMLGYQEILGQDFPEDFRYQDVKHLLVARNIHNIKAIDIFDDRADLKYDLNCPVPKFEYEKYRTLLDIGTVEHIFDTRTCFENCLRMISVGGFFVLHTCVKGYFKHGLHVFNPDGLIDLFELNGFEIQYLRYSTVDGEPLQKPNDGENVLIWIVGKKLRPIDTLIIPQQRGWSEAYRVPPQVKIVNQPGTLRRNPIKFAAYLILKLLWNVLIKIKGRLIHYLR